MKERYPQTPIMRSLLVLALIWHAVAEFEAVASSPPWVPKSQHGEARTLLDPGPSGLKGRYKLMTIKLPDFIATFEDPTGKFVVQIHPSGTEVGSRPNWKGKRVSLTVRATTLGKEESESVLAELITLLQKRESRWGWLRKTETEQQDPKDIFSPHYRQLAIGKMDRANSFLEAMLRDETLRNAVLIEGIEFAYLGGRVDVAKRLAQTLVKRAEAKLTQDGESPARMDAHRLLLARAHAWAGQLDQLTRMQGGVLGTKGVCRATGVAAALHLSGQAERASKLLETAILPRANQCARALDLAVQIRVATGDVETAKTLLETYGRRNTNNPLTYLARARVQLASGRMMAGIDLLRTALRFSPKEPAVYDLLTVSLLLQRSDVGTLTQAKKRREEQLKNLPAQVYAGILCAAYRDSFCVEAAAGRVAELSNAPKSFPVVLMKELSALVKSDADLATSTRNHSLWQTAPLILSPLLIEHLHAKASQRPSAEAVARFAKRAYGPGFGDMVQQLIERLPSATGQSANVLNDQATDVKSKRDLPAGEELNEPVEEEFPVEPWVLLTLGTLLALLGLLAVRRQRAHRKDAHSEE